MNERSDNPNKQTNKQTDYLSLEKTNCLKGIFCVCILLHHLYQHGGIFREGKLLLLGACFQALGYFATAVFFFLSGYGLTASYFASRDLSRFPRKKILPFYIIILLMTVLYYGFYLLVGNKVEPLQLIKSLTFGGTIIINGWYLQVQLLYYLFFYFTFRFCKKGRQLAAMLCLHILYVILCICFHLPSLYYERTFIFIFGMVWYIKKDKVDAWLDRKAHTVLAWGISVVLLAFFYACSMLLDNIYLTTAARGVSYFFFVTVVVLCSKAVNVSNKITRFLGSISLELYVTQGAVMLFFHSRLVYIENSIIYIIVSTICSLLLSVLLRPLIVKIYKICRTEKRLCDGKAMD